MKNFRNLKILDMTATDISDKFLPLIATLKTLERAYLNGTKVTPDGVLHLRALPKLWFVELSHDRFTESDVQRLQSQMPRVQFRHAQDPYARDKQIPGKAIPPLTTLCALCDSAVASSADDDPPCPQPAPNDTR